MYVRFISPWRTHRRGIDGGLFGPAYDLWYDRETPAGLRDAIGHELDAFERDLPIPPRGSFRVRSRGRWLADGICWFRDDARAMIARAHVLAALIGECGVPIVRSWTD